MVFHQFTPSNVLLKNSSIQKKLLLKMHNILSMNVGAAHRVQHSWETDIKLSIPDSKWQVINSRGHQRLLNTAIQKYWFKIIYHWYLLFNFTVLIYNVS